MAVDPFSTVLDLYFGLYHLSYSSDLGVDEQPLVDGTSSTTFVLKVLLHLLGVNLTNSIVFKSLFMLLDSKLNILQGRSNRILSMLYNVYRTTFARIIFVYECIGNI